MVKSIAVFALALLASVTVLSAVHAQTASPSPTTAPTGTMTETPSGAPSTGFGP